MNKIYLQAARAIPEDARLVMEWRNDPATRAMSFHQEKKIWADFWGEFCQNYFPNPALCPQFALFEEERIGFLRFRPLTATSCDISINLAPQARGKSLSVPTLQAASEHLRALGITEIIAEVKLDNPVSQHIFVQAGYQLLGSVEKLVEDTGEELSILRYSQAIIS